MSCLGVHFALTHEEVQKLKSFQNEADRLEFLEEELERAYFEKPGEWKAESDKAWDAMHRALANGKLDYRDRGPLSYVVLAGEVLYTKDDYILSLKTPEKVKEVAHQVGLVTKDSFQEGYDRMPAKEYGFPKSAEDFEYTWEWFRGVAALYEKRRRPVAISSLRPISNQRLLTPKL
jgi:hypothetical protein